MKFVSIHIDSPCQRATKGELLKCCPENIADQLLRLYSISNGVEAHVVDSEYVDYLRIDEYEFIIDPDNRAASLECFEGLFQIGSDGAGKVLAFDLDRGKPHPIVMHCPGYHDRGQAPIIASNMDELIIKLGISIP